MKPNEEKPSEHDGHHEHEQHRHEHLWKLNVQGVLIEVSHPTIVVLEAIKLAGFDPETPWIIVLRIAGEPKREVSLSTVLDLRHHGIEKLRLTPRHINNGEAVAVRSLGFSMLPVDHEHLARSGLSWETVIDRGRRWLLIRGYPLPGGYSAPMVDIAIEVPPAYPGAQLDMFYCRPQLTLATGAAVPQTQVTETILDQPFQRWSAIGLGTARTTASPRIWHSSTNHFCGKSGSDQARDDAGSAKKISGPASCSPLPRRPRSGCSPDLHVSRLSTAETPRQRHNAGAT